MPTVIDETLRSLQQRLEELRPAVQEFQEVERAIAALDRAKNGGAATGGPTLGDRLFSLITERPGLTVAQAHRELGDAAPKDIKQLYRIAKTEVERKGRLRKDDEGRYFPVGAAAEPERGSEPDATPEPEPQHYDEPHDHQGGFEEWHG